MAYDLTKISTTVLMRPAFDAGIALTRLDERIARSPVGQGWIERTHFADACASLWIDGELVHCRIALKGEMEVSTKLKALLCP